VAVSKYPIRDVLSGVRGLNKEEEDGLRVRLDGKFLDFMRGKGLDDGQIGRVANRLLNVWAKRRDVDHEKEIEILLG